MVSVMYEPEPYLGLGVLDVEGDMLGGWRPVSDSAEVLVTVLDI